MTEANEVTTAPKDRPFLTAIVGLAAAIALGLIVFVFVSDFPGPSPAGGDTTKSEAPPEDVTR
jgi:hypothetical protein